MNNTNPENVQVKTAIANFNASVTNSNYAALVEACKNLLKGVTANGFSQTDNRKRYNGKFTVSGNALEEISNLIDYK